MWKHFKLKLLHVSLSHNLWQCLNWWCSQGDVVYKNQFIIQLLLTVKFQIWNFTEKRVCHITTCMDSQKKSKYLVFTDTVFIYTTFDRKKSIFAKCFNLLRQLRENIIFRHITKDRSTGRTHKVKISRLICTT